MKFYTIVAALVATAQARGSFWLNPFYFDHKSQIEGYDCPYGPKRCGVDKEGDDIYCGEAQACFTPIEMAPICYNAFPFQCRKLCPKG